LDLGLLVLFEFGQSFGRLFFELEGCLEFQLGGLSGCRLLGRKCFQLDCLSLCYGYGFLCNCHVVHNGAVAVARFGRSCFLYLFSRRWLDLRAGVGVVVVGE
jgi:hypothetical protein